MNKPERLPLDDAALVLRRDEEGVATLTLNAPARRNSLSVAMLTALSEALAALAQDAAIKVVVLAANGPAFCAGHDLKELTAHRRDVDEGRGFFEAAMRQCAALMQAIIALPQPVIACVQGIATAAGCQLVATCDLAVASTTAQFCTPGVNIGLFCSTPMVALTRNLGAKAAMEMLLTGDMVGAQEAQRLGLVNRCVAPEALVQETQALARAIAAKSTRTVRIGKQAFYRQREMPLDEAYAYAAGVMVENMLMPDAVEGIGAFIEKRTPRWDDCP